MKRLIGAGTACLLALGTGCQRDPSSAVPGQDPAGGLGLPGVPGAPSTRTQLQGTPIGVQPVPDTPVEHLPPHPGHGLLASTGVRRPRVTPPAPPEVYAHEWYVSTRGDDAADGSEGAPFRTLARALGAAGPGERIHVAAGTYAEKVDIGPGVRDGAPGRPITLQGEGRPRIVPSGETGALVDIRRAHWVVDGLDIDVQGQPRYAVTFQGGVEGSVLANCEVHHGAFGAGVTTFADATGATIENNHIHHFSRGDKDSHGIVIQTTTRDVTIRGNDIHDNSGDSVQCLGPEGFSNLPPAEGVLIEGNHLYANRENAVDIKTCHDVVVRQNRMHGFRAVDSSKGDAVVVHYSARNVLVEDNDIYDAGTGIGVGGNHEGPMPSGVVLRRNRIHDIVREGGTFGHGIRVENSTGIRVLNNTLTRIAAQGLVIGHGTGGPTEDGLFANNIVDAPELVSLGAMAPGLRMGGNLYAPGHPFRVGSQPTDLLDFTGWKAKGLDADSQQAEPALSGEALVPGPAAVDRGEPNDEPFCGAGPDVGAVETGCLQ